MSDTAVQWAMEPEVVTAIRQRRWLSFAMMVLVFGSGSVIGSGLTMIAVNDKYDARLKNPPSCRDHVLPAMQRELDLSEDQATKVKAILTDHDRAMGKIWMDMGPKWREQLKRLEEQVNGVLTADQQAKWHAWLEQRRRRVWPSTHNGRRPPKPHSESARDGRPHSSSRDARPAAAERVDDSNSRGNGARAAAEPERTGS